MELSLRHSALFKGVVYYWLLFLEEETHCPVKLYDMLAGCFAGCVDLTKILVRYQIGLKGQEIFLPLLVLCAY